MPGWRFIVVPPLPLQERFGAEQTAVELQELLPATDYSVTLYALYNEEPSDPVTAAAATCERTPLFTSSPQFDTIFCNLDGISKIQKMN